MSRIQEAIELLHDMRKTHRMQPLGYGRMIEDSFTKIFELLESEPEPTEFTKYLRSVIKEHEKLGEIKALQACDEIDRLTAEIEKQPDPSFLDVWIKRASKAESELKAKDERIKELQESFTGCTTCKDQYEAEIVKLEADLKAKKELIEALLQRPASVECPKCHIAIKAV